MINRTLRPYKCKHCDETFWTWKYHQIYCGHSCSRKAAWQSGAMENVKGLLKSGILGKGRTPWNKGTPWPEEMKVKLRQHGNRERFLKIRGGNGTGMSRHEKMLSEMLIKGWDYNHVVTVGKGRGSGYPNHYKIDFAWPEKMIALEVDGSSHSQIKRQAQDRKKEALLAELGWSVYRVTNKEVESMFMTSRLRVRPTTLRKVA